MKPNETPTPRTDKFEQVHTWSINPPNWNSFSRQLEHELAEANAENATLKQACDELHNPDEFNAVARERDELRAKLHAAEAACAEMRVALSEIKDHHQDQAEAREGICDTENSEYHRERERFCEITLSKLTQGQNWNSPEAVAAKDARIAEIEQQLALANATIEQRTAEANTAAALAKSLQEQLAEARKDSERSLQWQKCAKAMAAAIDDERKSDGSRGIYCAMTLSYAQEAGNIALRKFHELESGVPEFDNAKRDE